MINKEQFLQFLAISNDEWESRLDQIKYYEFKVKKSETKFRNIESPIKPLKNIQKKIAIQLTNFYSQIIPEAAYGYINKELTKSGRRDIISNARAHQGKKFLLNIDLMDFFHQIKSNRIYSLCKAFDLEDPLAEDLVKLVSYKGRLPMGAPSSPIISNIVTAPLDLELIEWAKKSHCYYTRYVDDLSVSSSTPLSDKTEQIIAIIKKHGYEPNPDKVIYYCESDVKSITGIDLTDEGLKVNSEIMQKTKHNVELLSKALHWARLSSFFLDNSKSDKSSKLKTIQRSIKGQLNFIKKVEGSHSEDFQKLKKLYKKSVQDSQSMEYSFYI